MRSPSCFFAPALFFASMRRLHHMPLAPSCRTIRLALAEKRLSFELVPEQVWAVSDDFFALNPAGTLPVLIDEDGLIVPDALVIADYLEAAYPGGPSAEGTRVALFPGSLAEQVEVRRLHTWFEMKFALEVSDALVYEKLGKRFMGGEPPEMDRVRDALTQLRFHMQYINHLTDQRRWIGGEQFSLADMAAAAYLSVLDYLGDVPWHDFEAAKLWYARVKSRPSFRALLADYVPGTPPPRHYADLDF